jgi:hexosaminidase
MFAALRERLDRLPKYAGLRFEAADKSAFIKAEHDRETPCGGYRLTITNEGISAASSGSEGLANALTTLYWKIREGNGCLACGEIFDAPAKQYRGILLDCSRRFFDTETIKSMIEQAAMRKFNRMHWHLSDDQGYRVESKRFPELNSVSSWRTEMDGSRYGGYYTWEQISDVVAFAAARGVEIVPEIDMPGHVTAIVAAFPQVSCSGEAAEVVSSAGIHPRILCAGKDETITFVKELLDEVCALFPHEYFHIGGDEAPKTEWQKCAHCQKRMQSERLANEEELQAWFTNLLVDRLAAKGKKTICWNESLKSGKLDERAVVQYWYEEPGVYASGAFNAGRKYIYSEGKEFYFDYSPALTPLRVVMNTKAHFAGGNHAGGNLFPQEEVLGFEAAFWAEQIFDRTRLEQLAFPRLFAVSERAWNTGTGYAGFLLRCEQETKYLAEDGVAHYAVAEADLSGEAQRQAIIADWKPKVQMVRQAGMEMYVPAICNVVRERMRDMFAPGDIEKTMRELVGQRRES